MRRKLLGLCLLISLFTFSWATYAQSHEISITLNQLTYTPRYSPFLLKDTLYVSGYDLACMTYGTFTDTEECASLTIQSDTLTYDKQTLICLFNGYRYLPHQSIYITEEGTVYYPLIVLDKFAYPYTYEALHLSLNPKVPYSTATDQYKYHRLYETTIPSYEALLSPLLKQEEIPALLTQTKRQNGYISFITTANKLPCLKEINKLIPGSPVTTLYLRRINTVGHTPSIADFEKIPITYKLQDNNLMIQAGEETLSCNGFWASYNPCEPKVSVDLHKSLDMMLMRTLYEHYRDTFHMKDNIHLSPIAIITYGRSDKLTYPVYFEGCSEEQSYQVVIYKQSTAHTVNYYMDLIVDSEKSSF